ncbi:TetR/AcrR family transcriptional regulator, partial [Clostridioides difficile]|uniref:TetR/AcrR family transcriptional regulator n=1 Tax=Clostridioides difficile TaxID=1496 RepID=UPI001C641913
LFYRRGIRAVGVDAIVTQAGVTKPSLYRSFPSKDELVADYIRLMGEEGLARFDATMAANRADPRGQFHVWLLDLLKKANK